MITNFTLSAGNEASLIEKIKRLDKTNTLYSVNIQPKKSKRSNQQNKWVRGLAKDFGEYLGYTPDECYELLMYKFCPEFIENPENGDEIRVPGHFSKKQDGRPRDTKDAAEIQDAMQRWAAQLGFVWEYHES